MKSRLPKERVEEQYGRQSNIIDYRYANYDIAAVEADYDKTVASFPARSLRSTRSTDAKPSILANDLFPSFPYECLTIL